MVYTPQRRPAKPGRRQFNIMLLDVVRQQVLALAKQQDLSMSDAAELLLVDALVERGMIKRLRNGELRLPTVSRKAG